MTPKGCRWKDGCLSPYICMMTNGCWKTQKQSATIYISIKGRALPSHNKWDKKIKSFSFWGQVRQILKPSAWYTGANPWTDSTMMMFIVAGRFISVPKYFLFQKSDFFVFFPVFVFSTIHISFIPLSTWGSSSIEKRPHGNIRVCWFWSYEYNIIGLFFCWVTWAQPDTTAAG